MAEGCSHTHKPYQNLPEAHEKLPLPEGDHILLVYSSGELEIKEVEPSHEAGKPLNSTMSVPLTSISKLISSFRFAIL